MNIYSFLKKEELEYLLACLKFAKQLGMIQEDTLDAQEVRRKKENKKRAGMLERGEVVYGPTCFSIPAYLHYELTGFQLEYATESPAVKKAYSYREIKETELQKFYEENPGLFTRYHGDSFSYEETKKIIRKKIRERDYEAEIKNILCQLHFGK